MALDKALKIPYLQLNSGYGSKGCKEKAFMEKSLANFWPTPIKYTIKNKESQAETLIYPHNVDLKTFCFFKRLLYED